MQAVRHAAARDRQHVTMVRPAAAAEHVDVRMPLAERPVVLPELRRIAGIEVAGLVELGMAAPRGVGAQAAHPQGERDRRVSAGRAQSQGNVSAVLRAPGVCFVSCGK